MTAGIGEELAARARDVELLVLDVDGVMTEGGLYFGPAGEAFKRFDVKDGHMLALARHVGLPSGILTARRSRMVELRARELGMRPVSQGTKDKGAGMRALLAEAGLDGSRVAYMGDDLNDLAPMRQVRLAACPADACPEVRAYCHYVARAPGGRGAVREVLELLLRAQGRWPQVLALVGADGR